jgi:methylmalonyl-CoA mutase C-terminal domain/subunit
VEAALQEDVDAIGLSLHSGAHMTLFPAVLRLLRERGGEDVLLTGGGIIPEADAVALREMGVGRLFGPGTSLEELTTWIRDEVRARRGVGPGRPDA